jgi:lysine/ornithine N-monooxygenase
MTKNRYSHKVTLNERRRENKKTSDLNGKSVSKRDVRNVFDTYYKNQVRALYRAVSGE